MYTNRFSRPLILALFIVAAVFTISFTTHSGDRSHVALKENTAREFWLGERYGVTLNVDSAPRSYTMSAKAAGAEASTVDSATRSYIAQAKAVACGVDTTYGLNLDSATQSYIAWAKSLESGKSCQ